MTSVYQLAVPIHIQMIYLARLPRGELRLRQMTSVVLCQLQYFVHTVTMCHRIHSSRATYTGKYAGKFPPACLLVEAQASL